MSSTNLLLQQMLERINELTDRVSALERKELNALADTVIKVNASGAAWQSTAAVRIGDERRTYGNGRYGQIVYRPEDAIVFEWR